MAHDFKRFPELTNSQMQFYYFDSPHQQITESFRARVVKVIDGDTIRVTCDFRDFAFPIRLIEINAPEMNEGGQESKSWLENQIIGEDIDVIVDPNFRVGKWGRLLGRIISRGLDMGEASMRLGFSTKFGERNFEQEMKRIWY